MHRMRAHCTTPHHTTPHHTTPRCTMPSRYHHEAAPCRHDTLTIPLLRRYTAVTSPSRRRHAAFTLPLQVIEEAIRLGLPRVEAGAQGEHKLARGYLPTLTFSAVYIQDANFRSAVSRFLEQERACPPTVAVTYPHRYIPMHAITCRDTQ